MYTSFACEAKKPKTGIIQASTEKVGLRYEQYFSISAKTHMKTNVKSIFHNNNTLFN